MSVATPSITTSEQPVIVSTDVIWRLSVDQYHAMIQAGILTEDDPVELLEGWLVTKMSKNPRHTFVTQLARDVVASLLPPGWYVNAQEPVTTKDSEPEPDVAVVRGNRRQYIDHHPGPQDIALVVEVADSSLQRDRSLKKRLYAAAGIPVYWIVKVKLSCSHYLTRKILAKREQPFRAIIRIGVQRTHGRARDRRWQVRGNRGGWRGLCGW